MSQLRRDPVLGRWVIISTERSDRPTDFTPATPPHSSPFCPFCPGNEDKTPPEVLVIRDEDTEPDEPGWHVRVVSNKYPALTLDGEFDPSSNGIYEMMNGIGTHEVIIESPIHERTLSSHDFNNMEKIAWIFRERIRMLERDERIKYVLIFRNAGQAAGASLAHPHSQLIATPSVPKRIAEEISGTLNYRADKGSCVFCDMIEQELASRERVIEENRHFVAFTPYASRFSYEIWVLPKDHSCRMQDMDDAILPYFASCFQNAVKRLDTALTYPPYNFVLHTSPFNTAQDYYYHWHIEILPRLTHVAGFEWGTGFYINPTPPEVAAEIMRNTSITQL